MTIFRQKRSVSLHEPLAYSVPQLGFSPFFASLLILTLVHLWWAGMVPPSEDEFYYWTWAQDLQRSYFDHPPLVAYLIRISTAVFGNNIFGIRFFAVVMASLLMLVIQRLCRRDELLTLVLFTPVFFLGSILMTPDLPFLFFWGLYVFWLVGVNRTLSDWNKDPVTRVYRNRPVGLASWLVGGVLLGLGGLSKYPMVLAVPCSALVLLTQPRSRGCWGGFFAHLAVAGLITLPVFLFNIDYDYRPFAFQMQHAVGTHRPFWAGLAEFSGTQILIVGALPLIMLPWVLGSFGRLRFDPILHVCAIFFAGPMLFFLWCASRNRLEANWALAAYISFWPVAQFLLQHLSFRTFRRLLLFVSFALPLAVSGALLVHLFVPLPWIPPGRDRIGQFAARTAVAKLAASDAKASGSGVTLFAPNYQWTAEFRFQGLPTEQLPEGSRPSEFTLSPVDPCAAPQVLVWEHQGDNHTSLSCFTRRELIGTYPFTVRGEVFRTMTLTRYSR